MSDIARIAPLTRLPLTLFGALALLAACGPTPEEQARMDAEQRSRDQEKCGGFGFQPNTEAFAHCMMGISSQREAQAAADRRAEAAREAYDKRQRDAEQAVKDQADRDAWDRKTGQGRYSSSSPDWSPSPSPSSPVDSIGNQILDDMNKMQGTE